jgi:phage FluMu protein Com
LVETRRKAASLLDERCLCGSLVAKVSLDGVEILCRRCKRIHLIPWPGERREGSAARKTRVAVDR